MTDRPSWESLFAAEASAPLERRPEDAAPSPLSLATVMERDIACLEALQIMLPLTDATPLAAGQRRLVIVALVGGSDLADAVVNALIERRAPV